MNPLRVELELDALYVDEDGTTLADLIIREAGKQTLAQVEVEAKREVGMNVRSVTREEITKAVQPLIQEAIADSVQMTNSLGEPRGEPTTLRKAIVDEATRQLREASTSSAARSTRGTLVQQFIYEEVRKAINDDLKQVMNDARAEVKAAVTAQAAEMITAAATRLP